MKFYVDEDGNRYSVDRLSGEKTLIEEAQSEGETGGPDTADTNEDDS